MSSQGKPLPIKAITIGLGVLFLVLVSAFLIVPAFLDVHVSDALFDTPQQPWMLSEEEQQRFGFTVNEMKGKYHFQQYCASCHGAFGSGRGPQSAGFGGRIPDLRQNQPPLRNGATPEQLLKTINEGLPGTGMPAFPHIAKHAKSTIVSYMQYLMREGDSLKGNEKKD